MNAILDNWTSLQQEINLGAATPSRRSCSRRSRPRGRQSLPPFRAAGKVVRMKK
jgi:hypothetical protein